jgi:WD40 repeat protein
LGLSERRGALDAALRTAKPRRSCCAIATWAGLAASLLIGALPGGVARAQDEVRNFKSPILLVETGGHHAPVRSLVWQDAMTLLSGGEDKVVKVWDFREDARLAQSIRPMIWRGPAGTIYAMAVSPKPDAAGQSLLAVAGFGIEARRGDITVFRLPGLARTPTGDVAARLLPPREGQPQSIGHTNAVTCLAFDPRGGGVLASGSADATIILWNVASFQPRAVLLGHSRGVRALAFSPNGDRLASAGADGSVRVWDVGRSAALDARTGNPQAPIAINALAYSPDGQFIVAGQEGGALFRFDARSVSQFVPARLPTRADQGPVEFMAFDPTGQRLAVSIKSDRTDVPDAATISCDVEVRAMPDGNILNQRRVPGLVRALAFSPDGTRLAYAGGRAQTVYIQDTAALDSAPRELRGEGSTPFELGFSENNQVIGFTRDPFDPANPPRVYGFDLGQRQSLTVTRDQLPNRAIREYGGWTLRQAANPFGLEAIHANGQRWRVQLDPAQERLWWSFTMVPPGPRHARPTVAIGTEAGVVIFDLETGRRTRVFAGHSAPVVTLAPSRDGRWLASGSLDQTVMIYPLADCDIRPGLGATFQQRPDGTWSVSTVARRSFAAAMGLKVGDTVVQAGLGWSGNNQKVYTSPQEIAEFVKIVDGLEPFLYLIGIKVRRSVSIPGVGPLELPATLPSTKRDNAALSLFLAGDKEWVLWTPQGYYETSFEGDTRFLGWHINPPFQTTRPTDFLPIVTYAGLMNRREVLERLWTTGDLDQAIAALPAGTPRPAAVVAADQPPEIVFAAVQGGIRLPAPGVLWAVDTPNPRLTVKIAAKGQSTIRARRIIFDERPLLRDPIVRPVAEFTENLQVDLVRDRRVRLAVEARSASGTERTETIDLVYLPPPKPSQPPPPPPVPPRLLLLAIGCESFPAPLRAVKYAHRDAAELARFLSAHLVSADGAKTLAGPTDILAGTKVSVHSIQEAIDRLHERIGQKEIRQHDIVAVVLASHLLASKEGTLIVASDSQISEPPRPNVAARELADVLGQLTDYGCRVILFLDGVHPLEDPFTSEIKPLVRELQQKRGVITFVASKEGPSDVDSTAKHGLFALGLLRVFQGADLAGARKDRTAPYTLDQFRTELRNTVLNLSERRQEAWCYIPPTLLPRTLFAKPQP